MRRAHTVAVWGRCARRDLYGLSVYILCTHQPYVVHMRATCRPRGKNERGWYFLVCGAPRSVTKNPRVVKHTSGPEGVLPVLVGSTGAASAAEFFSVSVCRPRHGFRSGWPFWYGGAPLSYIKASGTPKTQFGTPPSGDGDLLQQDRHIDRPNAVLAPRSGVAPDSCEF